MASQDFFVSYSRVEFYFTESLVARLKRQKLPIWFDVQELEPGTDWAASIADGLANCQAVIVIASRASIDSPNCQYERNTALKARKPIYVVLFESVELPPELRDAPTIDFRGSFEHGLHRLIESLQSGGQVRDPIRSLKPAPFGLPTRLPIALAVIFWSLLGFALISLITAVVVLRFSWAGTVLEVFIAIGYGYYWRNFYIRDYDPIELRSALWLAFILALIDSALMQIMQSRLSAHARNDLSAIMIGAALASLISAFLLSFAPAAFHWSPLGQAPESLRQRILHVHRKRDVTFTPLNKFYTLNYVAADQRVAAQVRHAMTHACYTEIPIEKLDADHKADHNLVILSNATPVSFISSHVSIFQKPVTIIASSIRMLPEIAAVTRYEGVDYRHRRLQQLTAMTSVLWLADSGQHVPIGEYYTIPESFQKAITPSGVTLTATLLRIFATLYLAPLIVVLIGRLLPLPAIASDFGLVGGSYPITALIGLLCLFLMWISAGLLARTISFVVSVLGLIALLAAIGLHIFATVSISVDGYINFVLLIFALIYALNLRGLYRWLPAPTKPAPRTHPPTEMLAQPFGIRLWRTNIALIVAFAIFTVSASQLSVVLSIAL